MIRQAAKAAAAHAQCCQATLWPATPHEHWLCSVPACIAGTALTAHAAKTRQDIAASSPERLASPHTCHQAALYMVPLAGIAGIACKQKATSISSLFHVFPLSPSCALALHARACCAALHATSRHCWHCLGHVLCGWVLAVLRRFTCTGADTISPENYVGCNVRLGVGPH